MTDRQKMQEDHARAFAAALLPAELPPVNILIVDDEPRNLTVLETILNEPSYRLVRAVTPDQALLALVNEEFALLILDVQMPGMNGFELAQTIKGRKKTAQIPIIFLTAHFNDDSHVLEGYGTGAVDYLHKPVNSAALRSKVAVFTELHRQRRELALANMKLAEEVVERTRAEDELRRWNTLLDQRIVERTNSLNASNARLRLATQGVRLGFWLWDLESDQWRWENDWLLDVLGLAQEDWPSSARTLLERMDGADAERFSQARRDALESNGDAFRFEGAVAGAGDRVFVIEIDGRNAELDSGKKTLLGTIRDVTERHRVEKQLRESEARYRTLFHSIDEGFCLVDPVIDAQGHVCDMRFIDTNAAFGRHSGLGELADCLASERIPDLDQEWLQDVGRALNDGLPFRRHGMILGIQQRLLDIHGFPVDESGRRHVGMLLRDVTERVRSHEALLERERFLTTVTQAARLGIAVIDDRYHYRFVNESFRRILNAAGPIDPGQPVGLLNPQRWARTKPAIDQTRWPARACPSNSPFLLRRVKMADNQQPTFVPSSNPIRASIRRSRPRSCS